MTTAIGSVNQTRRELLARMARNRIRNRVAILSQRDLAMVVEDGLGDLHKATVR
jgi:hypothetical protein